MKILSLIIVLSAIYCIFNLITNVGGFLGFLGTIIVLGITILTIKFIFKK